MKLSIKITRTILSLLIILTSLNTNAQLLTSSKGVKEVICFRVDPPNWYQFMGRDTLQLLFYGSKMNDANIRVLTPGFVLGENRSSSDGYLLHDLKLDQSFTGTVVMEISQGRKKQTLEYEILPKPDLNFTSSGAEYNISPSDAMYLIMPDRFKNGAKSNDEVSGMLEGLNAQDPFGRHGGDIKGMREGLPYIKEMGFTSIWSTPLWENNQPKQSYHGYACTDHYAIDARFGSMEEYVDLCKEARKLGLKMIVDLVYNHTGHKHPLYQNPVDTQWFHHYTDKKITNYRLATIPDPYALKGDRLLMEQGWFVKEMPDLNQSNPDVAEYLIQNTLWWLAKAELSGVRVDTYPYSELNFLSKLNKRLKRVFPNVFLFGETWEVSVATQAVYAPNIFSTDISGKPNSITDFQVCFALQKGLNEPWNWDGGLSRLYYALASDYLYQNPENLVTFIDNHDIDRIHGQFGKETWKTEMALGLLGMTRGIPCVFYGTEALMSKTGSHGDIREDLPGFNEEEKRSIFDSTERIAHEKRMIDWISSLNNIRTNVYPDYFKKGKRFQLVPTEGIYAAGIKGSNSVLLYAANQSEKLQNLDVTTLAELSLDFSKARLLMKNTDAIDETRNTNTWVLGSHAFYVWEIPFKEGR